MCNLAKSRENTPCFDCTHRCDSLCLPFFFSCGSILLFLLRMETLQSVLKIPLAYLQGTRKFSAEICCCEVEVRCNRRRVHTIMPVVIRKHHHRASTHSGLLFGDQYKMYEAQSAALTGRTDDQPCYDDYHVTSISVQLMSSTSGKLLRH